MPCVVYALGVARFPVAISTVLEANCLHKRAFDITPSTASNLSKLSAMQESNSRLRIQAAFGMGLKSDPEP